MVKAVSLGKFGFKPEPLEIDVFPRTAVCNSLKGVLTPEAWDVARKNAYTRSGYSCQHCGRRRPDGVMVYAVALWDFSQDVLAGYRVQKVRNIITVCSECFALRRIWPGLEECVPRLAEVWKVTCEEAYQKVLDAEQTAERDSQVLWALDLSWLDLRGMPSEVVDSYVRIIRDGTVMGEA